MQSLGLTGFGLNTGFLTNAQLAAAPYNYTAAQIAVLQYYFGAAPASAGAGGANGTGVLGNFYGNRNRISELIGMRRFNMADRNRDKLKANLDWQATEKFSLQTGVDYRKDDDANSVYGLENAKAWSLNLDANYAASDDLSFGAFYTLEDQRSRTAGNNLGTNSDGLRPVLVLLAMLLLVSRMRRLWRAVGRATVIPPWRHATRMPRPTRASTGPRTCAIGRTRWALHSR